MRVAAARGLPPLRHRLPFGCERPVAEAHTFHKPLPHRRQGKGQWLSLTFPHRACGRRVFGSAWTSTLPLLRLGCAHGARTARLLRARPMAKRSLCHSWEGRCASGSVKGKASSGRAALPRGRRRERRRCANEYDPGVAATGKMPVFPNAALPMWQGRPRPCSKAEVVVPRHRHFIGFAFGMCAAVPQCAPPCAHPRKRNASHKAKRFQRRAGHAPARERPALCASLSPPAYRQKLFSTFFKNPLARNATMWYHYGVSKTRLGSQRALEGWRDAQ